MIKIQVNGESFEIEGGPVSIIKGVFKVGNKILKRNLSGDVHVKWEGDLTSLKTDGSVQCGDVKGVVDAGGSVQCGNVSKDVDASGSVTCKDVGGDVDAGGSVKCQCVNGSIDSGGSVSMGL